VHAALELVSFLNNVDKFDALLSSGIYLQGVLNRRLRISDWSVVCGDSWSILEAGVVCRQLGLGFASDAIQSNFFGNGEVMPMSISGIECQGNEGNLAECLHDELVNCPGIP